MFKKNQFKPAKDGFSLIEVLIALTIFAVGVLGLVSMQGISLMSTDFGGNMSVARILVSDQLERLTGRPLSDASFSFCTTGNYCHSDIGFGANGVTPTNIDFTGRAVANGRYRRDWSVQNISPATSTARIVTVRVRWTDIRGGINQQEANSFNRRLEMTMIKVQ